MLNDIQKILAFAEQERKRKNLSLRQLAQRSGVSAATLSRLLRPRSTAIPELSTLAAIAHGLDYSFLSFLLAIAQHQYEADKEIELRAIFHKLTQEHRFLLFSIARTLLSMQDNHNEL